jgi:hypothetical protein
LCFCFLALGYYAYIEASLPRKQNDTAHLLSPVFNTNPSPGKCLSFFFHMYGPHIGQFNVYLKSGNSLGNPVWSKSGTQGNLWHNDKIPLLKQPPFQIVFEGVRGSSYKGDIALDDVQVTQQ